MKKILPAALGLLSCFSASSALAAASPTPAPKSSPAAAPAARDKALGRDPAISFVDLEQIFKNSAPLKAAEAKIEEKKSAAEKEYGEMIADYRKGQSELGTLDQRIGGLKLEDTSRDQLTKERGERLAVLQGKERAINQFRQDREQEVQRESGSLRGPILNDLKAAAERLGQKVNLVLDFGGNTLSGIPFVVLHPIESDITGRLAEALDGKQAASVNATRGVSVAVVDMNRAFTQLRRTKDAETKINAVRAAAQSEVEQKANTYKEERAKIDTLTGAEKDQQLAKVAALEKELGEFTARKSSEVQSEITGSGQPILAEMATALGKMAGERVGLVFDSSGMSVAGVPLLLWSKDLPDLSDDLVAVLNGGKADSPKTNGVPSTKLRFAVVDIERAYRNSPDGRKAEDEIQEAAKTANAEMANATPQAQAQKQQELQNLVRSKRQAVLGKLREVLGEIGRAGDFNAVFDTGKTLTGGPAVLYAREIPDLTDEVVAKISPAN